MAPDRADGRTVPVPARPKVPARSSSLKRSAPKMPGKGILILAIVGVWLFLLSCILASNSWSYLEKYENLTGWLAGWLDCPVLSGTQRQRRALSNQSFPCGVYWYEDTVTSFSEWSKIFEALVKEKIYKGHFLLKSTYSISRKPHCITQRTWQRHHKSSGPIA